MSALPVIDEPFAEVFAAALRGVPCDVIGLGPDPSPLPVGHWTRVADASDRAVLTHCRGATLDLGCGPGRMSAHLAGLGRSVLGVDVVAEAVEQTQARGVTALCRDVFAPMPGEGRWETVLLADGNIGIGGDPIRLLRRVHSLLAARGRAVVDLAPYGLGVQTASVVLRTAHQSSRPFAWTVVGAESVGPIAQAAGFVVEATHEYAGRWFAVLVKES
ncbi:putative Type 12 methyltransferase [metagenome]|uniref:Putative Type 12 methyltransferase n=1 Tax=metagenome TaxID=256318 RepID=A0A2P2C156_9ZZZZ